LQIGCRCLAEPWFPPAADGGLAGRRALPVFSEVLDTAPNGSGFVLYQADAGDSVAGMPKLRILASLLSLSLSPPLPARTWTDKDGRSMEAEIVGADGLQVTVNKGGKEFKMPLDRLSDKDREYVKEWLEEQEDKADDKEEEAPGGAAAGQLTFDGKPLVAGGKTNLFQYDYSPEQLENTKKLKGKDTGYKIALALPADFNPAKPQKVFVVSTAVNDAKQGLAGNVGMMGFFGKQCAANGWVCLAYDTNLGRQDHDGDLMAALEKINAQWPQFKTWDFAVGGFSGGAKACFFPCAYLLKHDYKVVGAFLAGCNEDRSGAGQATYRVPKSAYKNVKVFLGNPTYKADYAPPVAASLKKNGMSKIRAEVHQGKNSLDYGQFAVALKWFAGQE
jgi:hypothetical protein